MVRMVERIFGLVRVTLSVQHLAARRSIEASRRGIRADGRVRADRPGPMHQLRRWRPRPDSLVHDGNRPALVLARKGPRAGGPTFDRRPNSAGFPISTYFPPGPKRQECGGHQNERRRCSQRSANHDEEDLHRRDATASRWKATPRRSPRPSQVCDTIWVARRARLRLPASIRAVVKGCRRSPGGLGDAQQEPADATCHTGAHVQRQEVGPSAGKAHPDSDTLDGADGTHVRIRPVRPARDGDPGGVLHPKLPAGQLRACGSRSRCRRGPPRYSGKTAGLRLRGPAPRTGRCGAEPLRAARTTSRSTSARARRRKARTPIRGRRRPALPSAAVR